MTTQNQKLSSITGLFNTATTGLAGTILPTSIAATPTTGTVPTIQMDGTIAWAPTGVSNITITEPAWRTVNRTIVSGAATFTITDNPQAANYVFSGATNPTTIVFSLGMNAISDGTATISFTASSGTNITGFTSGAVVTLTNGQAVGDVLIDPTFLANWWSSAWTATEASGVNTFTYTAAGNPITATGTLTINYSATGWQPATPPNETSTINAGGNQAPTFKQYGLPQILAGGNTTGNQSIVFNDGTGTGARSLTLRAPSSGYTTSHIWQFPSAPPSIPSLVTYDPSSGSLGYSASFNPGDEIFIWANALGVPYYTNLSVVPENINGTWSAFTTNIQGAIITLANPSTKPLGSQILLRGASASGSVGIVTGVLETSTEVHQLRVQRDAGYTSGSTVSWRIIQGALVSGSLLADSVTRTNSTITVAAAAAAGATTVMTSAALTQGNYYTFTNSGNDVVYQVTAISGTTATINPGLAAAVGAGATIYIATFAGTSFNEIIAGPNITLTVVGNKLQIGSTGGGGTGNVGITEPSWRTVVKTTTEAGQFFTITDNVQAGNFVFSGNTTTFDLLVVTSDPTSDGTGRYTFSLTNSGSLTGFTGGTVTVPNGQTLSASFLAGTDIRTIWNDFWNISISGGTLFTWMGANNPVLAAGTLNLSFAGGWNFTPQSVAVNFTAPANSAPTWKPLSGSIVASSVFGSPTTLAPLVGWDIDNNRLSWTGAAGILSLRDILAAGNTTGLNVGINFQSNSSAGILLKAPATGVSAYTLTLPSGLPGINRPYVIGSTSAGVTSFETYVKQVSVDLLTWIGGNGLLYASDLTVTRLVTNGTYTETSGAPQVTFVGDLSGFTTGSQVVLIDYTGGMITGQYISTASGGPLVRNLRIESSVIFITNVSYVFAIRQGVLAIASNTINTDVVIGANNTGVTTTAAAAVGANIINITGGTIANNTYIQFTASFPASQYRVSTTAGSTIVLATALREAVPSGAVIYTDTITQSITNDIIAGSGIVLSPLGGGRTQISNSNPAPSLPLTIANAAGNQSLAITAQASNTIQLQPQATGGNASLAIVPQGTGSIAIGVSQLTIAPASGTTSGITISTGIANTDAATVAQVNSARVNLDSFVFTNTTQTTTALAAAGATVINTTGGVVVGTLVQFASGAGNYIYRVTAQTTSSITITPALVVGVASGASIFAATLDTQTPVTDLIVGQNVTLTSLGSGRLQISGSMSATLPVTFTNSGGTQALAITLPNSTTVQLQAQESGGNGVLSLVRQGTGTINIGSSQLVISAPSATTSGITAPNGIAPSDVATVQLVTLSTAGIRPQNSVGIATHIVEGNIAGTYTNNTGIGTATFTGTAPLTNAGVTPAVNSVVLLAAQTNQIQNGPYTVTANPGIGTYTLTRTNTAIAFGNFWLATLAGANNNGVQYENVTTTSPIVVGTTNLVYAKFGESNALPPPTPSLSQVMAVGRTVNSATSDGLTFGSDSQAAIWISSSAAGPTRLQFRGGGGTGNIYGTSTGLLQLGGTTTATSTAITTGGNVIAPRLGIFNTSNVGAELNFQVPSSFSTVRLYNLNIPNNPSAANVPLVCDTGGTFTFGSAVTLANLQLSNNAINQTTGNLTITAAGTLTVNQTGTIILNVPNSSAVIVGPTGGTTQFTITPTAAAVSLGISTTAASTNLNIFAGGAGNIALGSPLSSNGSVGVTGQFLQSRGAGQSPQWATAGGTPIGSIAGGSTKSGDQTFNPNANTIITWDTNVQTPAGFTFTGGTFINTSTYIRVVSFSAILVVNQINAQSTENDWWFAYVNGTVPGNRFAQVVDVTTRAANQVWVVNLSCIVTLAPPGSAVSGSDRIALWGWTNAGGMVVRATQTQFGVSGSRLTIGVLN